MTRAATKIGEPIFRSITQDWDDEIVDLVMPFLFPYGNAFPYGAAIRPLDVTTAAMFHAAAILDFLEIITIGRTE